MKKTILVIFVIVGGIALVGLGFCSGLNSAKYKALKGGSESPISELLSSKVIDGLTAVANGQVKEISGRNLVITANGEELSISVKDDADIGKMVPVKKIDSNEPQPVTRESIKFEEIKFGDSVNILCKLSPDLSLEALNVTILP